MTQLAGRVDRVVKPVGKSTDLVRLKIATTAFCGNLPYD